MKHTMVLIAGAMVYALALVITLAWQLGTVGAPRNIGQAVDIQLADLQAQQYMAAAAVAAVGVSFIALVVTAAGLLYVRKTFVETQRAAAAAVLSADHARRTNEITLMMNRPWIELDVGSPRLTWSIEQDGWSAQASFRVVFENFGGLPAFRAVEIGLEPGEVTDLDRIRLIKFGDSGLTVFPHQKATPPGDRIHPAKWRIVPFSENAKEPGEMEGEVSFVLVARYFLSSEDVDPRYTANEFTIKFTPGSAPQVRKGPAVKGTPT